jgi:diguanylate cyclase (GGDEF)-like protein
MDELDRLQAENAQLRERLTAAEGYTAQTLARATRLSQVVSILAHDDDFDAVVDRAAVEVAELFAADIAVLLLGPDAVSVEGHCGLRASDVPEGSFVVDGLDVLTAAHPVLIGPADEVPVPAWVASYGGRHVAWARLLVGEDALGLMLLIRREPVAFERSDEKELRAIAYRIALALENGLLHRRVSRQLIQVSRVHERTTQLAATLELEPVAQRVAEMLVSEVAAGAAVVLIDRDPELVPIAWAGCAPGAEIGDWHRLPLDTAGMPVGCVAVAQLPAAGSEDQELLLHLLGIAALALDKALLYERTRVQAREDSLTSLLGHRAFHEVLEAQTAQAEPFSIVLLDIDDFKDINDLYGHQAGDEVLRLVADALRDGMRGGDGIFRIGGEEFCVVLPGLEVDDAFTVAERLRRQVATIVAPLPVTVSLGIASFPQHARRRDELFAHADTALYASKRAGKNRSTVAGTEAADPGRASDRHGHLALLHRHDAGTAVHSATVATIAVDIARALGLGDARLEDLRIAAKLHDIGKIGVPDAILKKPGPLDEEEFGIVKTHPTVGAELMCSWGLAGPARFVLEHHERIDGTGYPAGLCGDEICLESRIIHVADALVAMTLDRPYRHALSADEAAAELERHRGTQFDSAVLDALLTCDWRGLTRPPEPPARTPLPRRSRTVAPAQLSRR